MFLCKTTAKKNTGKSILLLPLILISCLIQPVSAAEQYSEIILKSHWPEYVNGTNMLSLPQIANVLQQFEEHEKISISIRYPGGDDGRKWGESLLNWFISFGIPSAYLEMLPGSGAANRLIITLTDRR